MNREFNHSLLEWFSLNKRTLPWRLDKEPYKIWISEIMLQQTRIEACIDYYYRFIDNIPDIETLASIPLDKLLKLWEGLGYYNRAKNLQKAAIIIMEKYQGKFPDDYSKILELPGVGEYTASAISSICFNKKEPTVDGNVLRVYTRINKYSKDITSLKTKKEIRENLKKIMPDESGNFNEAMMELGEKICLPNTKPKCNICPVSKYCKIANTDLWLNYPVKSKKTVKKTINYTILILKYQDKIAISKRTKKGILNGLWGFIDLEGNLSIEEITNYLKEQHIDYLSIESFITNKHIFTHQIWYMNSYLIKVKTNNKNYTWASISLIDKKYALPTAFKPLIEELKNNPMFYN